MCLRPEKNETLSSWEGVHKAKHFFKRVQCPDQCENGLSCSVPYLTSVLIHGFVNFPAVLLKLLLTQI